MAKSEEKRMFSQANFFPSLFVFLGGGVEGVEALGMIFGGEWEG